jgi:hypothetical protein
MKGGVFLTRGGTLVDGVLHMTVHGTLSLLTNASAYGTIFRIDCQDTPFSGMNHQPITSICLKMCIVNTPGKTMIGTKKKNSVSIEEFVHEVKLQQDIFIAVSSTSDEKVCPGIITAMIDEQIPSPPPPEPTFFQRMLHRFGIQSIPIQIINKTLLETLQGHDLVRQLIDTRLPIGIIAMEMMTDALPLDMAVFTTPDDLRFAFISATAKLVRIFFRRDERGIVGTVHCDCHLGNVLANDNGAIILDFGRTVDRHTPFSSERRATFEARWGEPLSTVYDRCCAFDEILFPPKTRGTDNGVAQLQELLHFFIFIDSLDNQLRLRRPHIQMDILRELLPDVGEKSIPIFTKQIFPADVYTDLLAECRRSRRIIRAHPPAELRTLQEEGRLFTGEPTKRLRGDPLSGTLPPPKMGRDDALEPMSEADKLALFTYLTEHGLTAEQASEIVEGSSQNTSIHDLIAKALSGGNNKRIKNVSKHSTASHYHATRRHSSQRKKSGTLRRVQR